MATKRATKKTAKTSVSASPRKTRTRNVGRSVGRQFTMDEIVSIAASTAVGVIKTLQGGDTVQTVGQPSNSAKSATRSNGSGNGDSRPGRKPDPTSGLSKARALFAKMKGRERQEVVQSFIKDLDIAPKTANAYFHLIENKSPDANANRAARGGRKATGKRQSA